MPNPDQGSSAKKTTRFRLGIVAGILLAGSLAILAGCRSIEDGIYNAGVAIGRFSAGVSTEWVDTETHGRLAYLHRHGEGPTIVLLHGFAAQKEIWLPMIRNLPREYRIVAIDLPGHGQSDRPSEARYRTRDFVEGIGRALEEIAPEEFHLMGASLGGKIAMRYTLGHPERVKTLGLISPAAFHPPEPSDLEEQLADGVNPILVDSREEFDQLVDLLFYDPPFMPWPVASVLARRAAEDQSHRRRMWEDLWENRREIQDELADFSLPVFLVWGRNDRVVDVSGVQVFKDRMANATLEITILEETGHSPMLERPDTLADTYLEFLNTSAARVDSSTGRPFSSD